jgi:hypothetical protein
LLTESDLVVSEATAAPETTATPELIVRAYHYVENGLSKTTPSFELSGAPADSGYVYAVSENAGAVTPITGDTYAVTAEGNYTLTFYLLDASGNVADTSALYQGQLDLSDAAGQNEAWMMVNATKVYGSLDSLLAQAGDGATIYLLSTDVIELSNPSMLSKVNLMPDPGVFGGGCYVIVSDNGPDGE